MIIDLPPSASLRIAIKFDDFLFFYTLTPFFSSLSFGSVFSSSSFYPFFLIQKEKKKYYKERWVGGCDAPAGGHISRELGHLSLSRTRLLHTQHFPP
jgi:hypothetical protein